MESSALVDRKNKSFDGSLNEEEANQLVEFAETYQITNFSQTLAEFILLAEWQNEKKTPEVSDLAVYNSLLRLEKSTKDASSWELYGSGNEEGRLIEISTFEMNMLEQTFSNYLVDMFHKNSSQILFFPLWDLFNSEVIVKWRILEKIASVKITPHQTIYKLKLTEFMKQKINFETCNFLEKELSVLKLSGKNTVLKDAESLIKILKELESQLSAAADVIATEGRNLFQESNCSYFDCVAKAVDDKLYPVCLQVMESMDIYQEFHRTFHVNLRDSCALSHSLFLNIKKVTQLIRSHASGKMMIEEFHTIFVKFFMNLLQVMKFECHSRIKRSSSEEEKDTVHSEERIFSSSVIVLNCICTVTDEWKHLEIDDEEMRLAYLIKITDIICDGAKIYAEVLDRRFSMPIELQKDTCLFKKLCMLTNSIDHVRCYLSDLPKEMLHFTNQAAELVETFQEVERILNLIHKSMDAQIRLTVDKLLKSAVEKIQLLCEKSMLMWLQGNSPNQGFDKFMNIFFDYVDTMQSHLKDELFPKFLSQMRSAILIDIQNDLLEGQPPEYAIAVKENVLNLEEYFIDLGLDESETCNRVLAQILSVLDLNSKTTVDLQLDYYSHIAESIVSPVEYLGHIAFQAGFKTIADDVVELNINVQKGQRLPARKFQLDELVVKLELFPSSLFPYQGPLKSSSLTEELDNPAFNQLFQFSNLTPEVLNVKGAVVQVLVLNQDKTYSAEAVLLLNQIQNMSGFTSVEFLPVYLMPLKQVDMSQMSYQVLANRSRWDKSAKVFINSRNKLNKNRRKFLSCIPGKHKFKF